MSTESDPQPQEFGAIEVAVKETARGRAFLAHYARRVQQSDTLTMLAMLARLERQSRELALQIQDLASGAPASGHSPKPSVTPPPNDAMSDPMQRIDELAQVLGNLHRRAAQLATRAGTQETVSPRPAAHMEPGDEELLGHIADALER